MFTRIKFFYRQVCVGIRLYRTMRQFHCSKEDAAAALVLRSLPKQRGVPPGSHFAKMTVEDFSRNCYPLVTGDSPVRSE